MFSRNYCNLIENLPTALVHDLQAFLIQAFAILPEDCQVYLIGSAARNEFTWFPDQALKTYSDIEFLVTHKSSLNLSKINELNDLAHEIVIKSHIKSRHYKIDLGFYSERRFRMLPDTLWKMEVIFFAVPVFALREHLIKSDVQRDKFDHGNLNELAFVRLTHFLKELLSQEMKLKEISPIFLSRNYLEIATILLPKYGIFSCGYASRIYQFCNNYNFNATIRKNLMKSYLSRKGKKEDDLLTSEEFLSGYIYLIQEILNIHDLNELTFRNFTGRFSTFKETPYKRIRRIVKSFYLFRSRQNNISLSILKSLTIDPRQEVFFSIIHIILNLKEKCFQNLSSDAAGMQSLAEEMQTAIDEMEILLMGNT
jgi:hypothetical protein